MLLLCNTLPQPRRGEAVLRGALGLVAGHLLVEPPRKGDPRVAAWIPLVARAQVLDQLDRVAGAQRVAGHVGPGLYERGVDRAVVDLLGANSLKE